MSRARLGRLALWMLGVGCWGVLFGPVAGAAGPPVGLVGNAGCKPYLSMPQQADGPMPQLLSQTGAFQDTPHLVPSPGLIPYQLLISFWSDGARKWRWMAAPRADATGPQKIHFSPTGEWKFPPGTVFVKHFELPTDETHPDIRRRLETRLLVCNSTGGVYGVTYKWRSDNSDAELLPAGLTERITIRTDTGTRTQTWAYPSQEDCRTCHTTRAGGVLGPKTRQLNCEFANENQLRAWNHLGLFEPALDDTRLASYPALAASNDPRRSLEDRARSYLDANCAHCHRPGGTVANFDARYDTPLAQQGLIDGPVLIDEGLDGPRVVAPRDIWRSVLFLRVNTLEGMKMPPLAHQELDRASITLLRDWIESLPGRPVLAPPSISPPGGQFVRPVLVTLAGTAPGAEIHYTLDGSAPTKQDPVYKTPLRLTASTVVRAKAYQAGFTKSITAQQVFVVGE